MYPIEELIGDKAQVSKRIEDFIRSSLYINPQLAYLDPR